MYALLGIDAVLRITAALLFLFAGVPALARRRPAALDRMQWFWWCAAAAVTAITIIGQLLTLLNVFSPFTLLLAIATIVIAVRARMSGRRPVTLLREWYRDLVRLSLHALEGRVNFSRRLRRFARRLRASLAASELRTRRHVFAWIGLLLVAAAARFYRPFATANLGFSDTYVHLYLVRLLEQGRQVDPAWGPYPRGMHFLLMSIRELTNVDAILLMNFFGPAAGVLMTLAAADTARRLTRNFTAGIVAGALFATMIGGAGQYFLLGGSMATDRVADAKKFVGLSHDEIPPTRGEFDVLLTVFQRQTATLPQELALVFLFPAAMFLYGYVRERNRSAGFQPAGPPASSRPWLLTGYLFCTSAIAATHPGVGVPLVLLSGITVLATRAHWRDIRTAMVTGAAGIALGSTWMLGYIAYPYSGGSASVGNPTGAASGAAYYFPFLRSGDDARIVTYVALTPFLIACVGIAVALLVRAATLGAPPSRRPVRRLPGGIEEPAESRRTGRQDAGAPQAPAPQACVWASLAVLTFTYTHLASRYGLPELVEVRRNASWLAMSLAILLGVASVELLRTRITKIVGMLVAVLWLWRVPVTGANDQLINYSGYSATAFAVLEIQREHEPFTWTLVTYGQEFPMVLGKGFHLAAVDFLDRYDPAQGKLEIPTPYVFIAVEKNPHPFEINTWAARFSREDIQRRLQTWCFLYQRTHGDMHIYRDDENVRVYMIRRNLQSSSR